MNIIRANIRQFGMIIALVVIAILFQALTGGMLFRPLNIANLITQNGYILILAVGMMFVILTGRIDLSVGTHLAFASALSGVLMVSWGWPVWVAVPAILLLGALFGAWHGFWIAYQNIPFFVVTLAGMLIFRGLTMFALRDGTIVNFPDSFHNFAAGFIPDFVGGSGLNITAILIAAIVSVIFIFLEFRKRIVSSKYGDEDISMLFFIIKLVLIVATINLFGYWFAQSRGVPNIMILLAASIIVYNFIANKTVMGRHVYATGGNEKAAVLNGLKTKRVVFWVYVNMGMLAALAGMVFASRLNAASPRAEAGFELQAIAACFIGGASPSGGVGKITGAIIGAMVMGILSNGLGHMGLGADIQLAITGLVVLAAVTFDVFTRTKVSKGERVKSAKETAAK
ncbi:MAG: sugar ABC transporter permease [Oscillospiraceae bacterium]|nr:sugar ABC transporter permease [Oscillospiraceae bacterium]MCL2278657.1 sugar ABC transporter permease [Oscillospiraceae bacterium]